MKRIVHDRLLVAFTQNDIHDHRRADEWRDGIEGQHLTTPRHRGEDVAEQGDGTATQYRHRQQPPMVTRAYHQACNMRYRQSKKSDRTAVGCHHSGTPRFVA